MPDYGADEWVTSVEAVGVTVGVVIGAVTSPSERAWVLHVFKRAAESYPQGSCTRDALEMVCEKASGYFVAGPKSDRLSNAAHPH